MRKIAILLLCLLIIGCFISCENDDHTFSSMQSESQSELFSQTQSDESSEKKNVEIQSTVKENNYYPIIDGYDKAYNGTAFPNEYGAYFRLIASSEECSEFSGLDVNESIFLENYIIALNIHQEWTEYGKKAIGYYDFSFSEGEYSIMLDYYQSNEGLDYPEWEQEFNLINYIVIPKSSIEYVHGVQKINLLTKESSHVSYSYIMHSDATSIYTDANGWAVVTSEDYQKLDATLDLYLFQNWPSLLLYFPNKLDGDFIFSNIKIVDGDLYLTIDNFISKDKNLYLKSNDCKFYQIFNQSKPYEFINYEELKENFKIYITIYTIDAPVV